MLSATEVSPPKADRCADRATVKLAVLLCCLFMTVLFVEVFTRVMHDRRKVTLTVEQSVDDAVAIRHEDGRKQVLFAGNSLIFMDVERHALQDSMGERYLVHTAGVSGSTYYDWRYGLRALFHRGGQPDLVVFAISPSQFLRAPTVSPLIVSKLWRNEDVVSYFRDLHLNLTTFAELLLERYSTFFSLRDIVRIYVRKVIPGFEDLVGIWARPTAAKPRENQPPTKAAYVDKLSKLAQELPSNTQLVILIPPTNQTTDAAAEPFLREAAQELGIPVEEPVHEYEWPSSRFQVDEYHLNPKAAADFSHIVGADVARLAASQNARSMVAAATGQ
jgi:hypothetical protein